MKQFGGIYSQYYDLLYADKDYIAEVNYVEGLIKADYPSPLKTILDLGCGTGRHAELLCARGYLVHGVDISEEMLSILEKRRAGKEDRLSFSLSNISDFSLNQKFNTVISLFHVMSYQNNNNDLIKTFRTAKKHLDAGGLFIFDFWYGPAVLTDFPSIRVKKLENEKIKVTRIAEPFLYPEKNIVDVRYTLFLQDKITNRIVEKKESHKMRYFFDTDLDFICQAGGFEVLKKYSWMTKESPSFNSWNVVWVVVA